MKALTIISMSTVAIMMIACGSGSDNKLENKPNPQSNPQITTKSYVGAGSRWDVNLSSNNTFNIEYRVNPSDTTPTSSMDGNYTTLASHFLELNATDGSSAYALEVPGYAFFLQPTGSSNVIPMITSGVCPQTSFSANYIKVKSDDLASDATEEFIGSITYNPNSTTGNFVIDSGYNLTGFSSVNIPSSIDGNCTDGVMELTSANDTAYIYMSASGGAIAHSNVNEITFATPIDSVTLADLSGTYTGITYTNNTNDRDAVKLTCNASGVCSAVEIDGLTDINTSVPLPITFTAANTPSTGFVTGTVDGHNLACSVDLDAGGSGKNVLSCVTGGNNLTNILLVQR